MKLINDIKLNNISIFWWGGSSPILSPARDVIHLSERKIYRSFDLLNIYRISQNFFDLGLKI